jgi:hypothetical protein
MNGVNFRPYMETGEYGSGDGGNTGGLILTIIVIVLILYIKDKLKK